MKTTSARPAGWSGLLLGLCLLGVPCAADAVTYANTAWPFNWIDASTHIKLGPTTGGVYSTLYQFRNTGGCGTNPPAIDDTLSDNIPIGFTFMYAGVNFTQVRVMSNGRLQFNNNLTCGYGSPVTQLPYPDASMNYTMRIYGNDLDPSLQSEIGGSYVTNCTSRASCYVSYATLGTAPYRSFVVTWSNVPEWTASGSGGSYNLQIILQENGEFIYQYGADTPGPQAATAQVGWQADFNSNDYDVPAVGFPANNSAIKFYIARPVAEYRFEQPVWNGTADEVLDTSGNAHHGTALTNGPTTRPADVAAGQVCRGAQIANNTTTAAISAIDTGIAVPTTIGSVGTFTFWYNNASNTPNLTRMLFDASTVNNRWFYLTRSNNGALSFVVTDSGNTNRTVTTANNAVPATGWSHIAVSWNFNNLAAANSDHLRIWINGVMVRTSAFTTAAVVSAQIDTLYIGDNRSAVSAVGNSAGNPGGTSATLDEFRIYNYEGGAGLIQRDMNLIGACLDHYAITTSGTASTCQPVQVTITAHDIAHGPIAMPNNTTQIVLSTSTGRGDWSLVSGYGAFNNGVADDGLATYLFNGEYQVVLNYQATIAGNVNFNVTDGQIVESGTEDPTLSVGGCVSSFNGCEPTTPQCTPAAPPALGYAALFTKLAGTGFSLEGAALKAGGTLENGFSGSVAVDLLANINNGVALNPNNCPVSQDAIIALGNATFSTGRATIGGINIANAYRDVRMRFTCAPGVCGSSITACSSDSFAVRPQSFTVTANLGGPTLAAGNNFTMTAATAVAAGYTGTPVLDTTQVLDHNAAPAGVLNGSFGAATGSSATGTFQYHDVGTILLLANAVTDSSYTTVDQSNSDCIAASTSNTLAGGKYGCNVGSVVAGPFGRFYPHHFTYAATLTGACAGGGFSYMDQPALGVNLTLTAQSANGTTTTRYTAGYPTLGTFSITGDNGGAPVAVSRLSSALPAFVWSNGVYTANGNRAFTRNATPDGAYENFALKAAVTDPDGATIAGSAISNATRIRYGRLLLYNAFGSEKSDLALAAQAQYWSGQSWVLNSDDTCTGTVLTAAGGANAVALSGYVGPVVAPLSSTNLGTSHVSGFTADGAGKWNLTLTKPSPVATGSVGVAINLGSGTADQSCLSRPPPATTGLALPWLRAQNGSLYPDGTACPTTYDRDPSARATFGIYAPETKRTIHMRELF